MSLLVVNRCLNNLALGPPSTGAVAFDLESGANLELVTMKHVSYVHSLSARTCFRQKSVATPSRAAEQHPGPASSKENLACLQNRSLAGVVPADEEVNLRQSVNANMLECSEAGDG